MPDWLLDHQRTTLFAVQAFTSLHPRAIYVHVAGVEPEEQTTHRGGLGIAVGDWQGGKLVAETQVNRIDVALNLPPSAPQDEPGSLGLAAKVTPFLVDKMADWLKDVYTRRLGYGCVLWLSAASQEEVVQLMQQTLPSFVASEGVRDVLYQVNRPRTSRVVEGLRVNRVARWSIQQAPLAKFEPQRGGVIPIEWRYRCALELDINTDAEHPQTIEAQHLAAVYRELVAMADEIAARGDVP